MFINKKRLVRESIRAVPSKTTCKNSVIRSIVAGNAKQPKSERANVLYTKN